MLIQFNTVLLLYPLLKHNNLLIPKFMLIPKSDGGRRPIGLFPAIHRIWTRVRRPDAEKWEDQNPCGIFAACRGQAATDTVWAQAPRAEMAAGHKQVAAAALFDLKSCAQVVRGNEQQQIRLEDAEIA